MGRSDALVDILCKTIVRSQNSCLSASQNAFLLEISKARNVNIENMAIIQLATSESRCVQNIEIDAGSLEFDIAESLRATVQATQSNGSDVLKLTNTIKHSILADDVEACLSDAKNDYQAQFDEVGGDFNSVNFKLDQIATASMTRCMQNGVFKVGDVTVPNYIERALQDNPNISIIPPTDICTAATNLYYGFAGSAAVALLIIAGVLLWNWLSPQKRNNVIK